MADKKPDTDLASAIRQLQDEIDGKIAILEALRSNYDPAEIDYYKYLKTTAWENMRQKTFRRDGFKCVICGTEKNLECHHLTYDNLGAELRGDLITLCKDCHRLLHEGKTIEQIKLDRGAELFTPPHPCHKECMTELEFLCISHAGALEPEVYNSLDDRAKLRPCLFKDFITKSFVDDLNNIGFLNTRSFCFNGVSVQGNAAKIKGTHKADVVLDLYKQYLSRLAIQHFTGLEMRILRGSFLEGRPIRKPLAFLEDEIAFYRKMEEV